MCSISNQPCAFELCISALTCAREYRSIVPRGRPLIEDSQNLWYTLKSQQIKGHLTEGEDAIPKATLLGGSLPWVQLPFGGIYCAQDRVAAES